MKSLKYNSWLYSTEKSKEDMGTNTKWGEYEEAARCGRAGDQGTQDQSDRKKDLVINLESGQKQNRSLDTNSNQSDLEPMTFPLLLTWGCYFHIA